MAQKGYSEKELFDAGLVKRGQRGGFYDTFRNRLMFPVIDVRGDVIGFSGRILSGDGAKYMNSPDTLVYNKSRNLFGLNLAKKSKSGYLLLVEGNVDVVSLHQAGFDSAVASLGTALTAEQARLTSRYTSEIILCYDADEAGQKASQRAIGLLEKLDMKVRVLSIPDAKDPDEYLKKKGADAFRNLLTGSEDQVDYRLNSVKTKYDLGTDAGKVGFLKEATELLATLPGPVERQVYAMRAAEEAGVGADAVIREVERRRKVLVTWNQAKTEKEMNRPERAAQPPERELRYQDPGSAAAEEGLIRLLYLEPGLIREELPAAEEFSSPALAKIYQALREKIETGSTVNVNSLATVLEQDEMNLLVRILQKPEALNESRNILSDYIRRIREKQDRGGPEDLNALSERLRKTKGIQKKG